MVVNILAPHWVRPAERRSSRLPHNHWVENTHNAHTPVSMETPSPHTANTVAMPTGVVRRGASPRGGGVCQQVGPLRGGCGLPGGVCQQMGPLRRCGPPGGVAHQMGPLRWRVPSGSCPSQGGVSHQGHAPPKWACPIRWDHPGGVSHQVCPLQG